EELCRPPRLVKAVVRISLASAGPETVKVGDHVRLAVGNYHHALYGARRRRTAVSSVELTENHAGVEAWRWQMPRDEHRVTVLHATGVWFQVMEKQAVRREISVVTRQEVFHDVELADPDL